MVKKSKKTEPAEAPRVPAHRPRQPVPVDEKIEEQTTAPAEQTQESES